jgi:hypothetical protein
MHQISARTNAWLLKLVTIQTPTKTAILKFPDRNSLERIHLQLTNKLQPVGGKQRRKLKETLVSTQRKLKEANKTIDELQDTNQTLLEACEKFAKKCKSLTIELQHHQQKTHQTASSHVITRDTVLEGRLVSLQALVESLKNEKTAMEIEYEMDAQDWAHRLTNLEKDLKEERAAMERMLEERQPLDELRLEVSVLTKQIPKERQFSQQLQTQLQQLEHQEQEREQMIWHVRRQRNNAFLELAQVKKERDRLRGERMNQRETQPILQPTLDLVKEDNDGRPNDETEIVCTWRSTSVESKMLTERDIRAGNHVPWSGSLQAVKAAFQCADQQHAGEAHILRGQQKYRSLYMECSQILINDKAWDCPTLMGHFQILERESPGKVIGFQILTLHPGTCEAYRIGTGRDAFHDQLQCTHFLPDNTPVGQADCPKRTCAGGICCQEHRSRNQEFRLQILCKQEGDPSLPPITCINTRMLEDCVWSPRVDMNCGN